MKMYEVTQEQPVAQPAAVEPEPTPQDIAQIQAVLGTIDPQTEQPQSLFAKLDSWVKQYPMLDKVTDLLPQTRLIKAIANAADAIEAGNGSQALAALAGGLTGGVANTVNQANRLTSTGTALAQGDVQGAALAAGGGAGQLARAAGATQNLAQGNVLAAANNVGGATARVANLAQKAAPQVTAALAAQQPVSEELARIRTLAHKQFP